MKTNQRVLQMVTIVALFIAIVFISVGFALMSTSLQITGTAKIVPATWDVHFDDESLEFDDNDTAAYEDATAKAAMTVNATQFTGYQIVLTKPGDHGTYTIDVVNDGDIDAEVDSATFSAANLTFTGGTSADQQIVADNITYTVTWDNGAAVTAGNTLAAHTTRTIKVDVLYDSEADALPSSEVVVAGRDLTINFKQAN